jgi:hypothetical protein
MLFDLTDQKGQIGLLKTKAGSNNAVVLDIRRDMFMMGMGSGRCRDMRMR